MLYLSYLMSNLQLSCRIQKLVEYELWDSLNLTELNLFLGLVARGWMVRWNKCSTGAQGMLNLDKFGWIEFEAQKKGLIKVEVHSKHRHAAAS